MQTNEHKTSSDGERQGIYTLNARTAMLLNVYQKDWGKKKKGIIPENGEKSVFSQEKYQFFLDAKFEISSRCCHVMKKDPIHRYNHETGRHPMTAQMADESRLRTQKWLQNGCNGFQLKEPISNPMAFWTENDVLQYIAENNLPICSVYGEVKQKDTQLSLFGDEVPEYYTTGCKRTGCCLCSFGAHMSDDDRFIKLKETHPGMLKLLDLCKNNGVTYREAIEWTNEHLDAKHQIKL